MFAEERRARILDLLREDKTVHTEDAARTLGVSVETIRRDLERLDHQGKLARVYGGAVPVDLVPVAEPPFEARSSIAASSKREIGVAAAALVNGAQTLFLDLGTTAMQVASTLPGTRSITVITPSMRVAEILAEKPAITIVVPGGTVRSGDLVMSGSQAVEFVRDVFPDLALLGSGGLSAKHGMTDFEFDEVQMKRTALTNSSRSYVLADSSKLGVTAPYRVCSLGELTGVVIDHGISTADREDLESAGMDLVVGSVP